jgi:hypothetical protein
MQKFAPVTEANLLFRFQRFLVYENIPLEVLDGSIYYLTIIPFQFESIAETGILGIKFCEPNNLSKTVDVKTRLLIYTGDDKELWEFLVRGIIQVLAQSRLKLSSNNYRLRIQKTN